ncbi:hypothetical protein H112_04577 [Trichophyton rubrum D6]|uniref:Uncharacterized protein n=3 Tax=Trichophyton TaxID=5550 RepID=A0A080WL66_TRIRC|nr:uncharacterized protein TERG_12138 [Trichophyton rubrum CBS 118892]EZF22616.1 hypothetical protein H100_04584 [Trichophyton rubrum MR850]EZF41660.1 hypothetical protein H102_04571 [Trichophyton rubrum CBS 100081]EZF52330.1 hypothetical protein H103_04579 [Trichophyton rubrum CBS 288.86]EZF62830.1 hypothetical protein H104_04567 [Trichophyton rubrum CBS 289.86]EZF73538.1 hypothetical protein H105_04594 [Trichophyton soudanense CBS 452.61]EZF84243.1 hypothetical protein H110_04572 [Trichophy
METSTRERLRYHAGDVEMTGPHSRIKCSRSSESERQSSPNIGSIAEPVSKRLEDESEPPVEAVVVCEMDVGSMMSQLQQLRFSV